MELHGIGIEDITSCLSLGGGRRILLGAPALAGGVVDGHSRLDVVAEDTEGEACPLVLYGESLHQDTVSHQIVPLEDGSDPVEHMAARVIHTVI